MARPPGLYDAVRREAGHPTKITWPNIYDGSPGTGKIAKRWNVSGWPTIYVLDHTGKIRYRDLRDEGLEKAVEKLLKKVPDKSDSDKHRSEKP